jgi:hypothetical protein
MFVQERFSQDERAAGAWTLFGNDPRQHKMFSKHMIAEEYDPQRNQFIERSKWNHYLDCAAACAAAAQILGARIVEDPEPQKQDWSKIFH